MMRFRFGIGRTMAFRKLGFVLMFPFCFESESLWVLGSWSCSVFCEPALV